MPDKSVREPFRTGYTSIRRGRNIDYYNQYSTKAFCEYPAKISVYDFSDKTIDAVIELAMKKFENSSTLTLNGSLEFKQCLWKRYQHLQQKPPSKFNKIIKGYIPTKEQTSPMTKNDGSIPQNLTEDKIRRSKFGLK